MALLSIAQILEWTLDCAHRNCNNWKIEKYLKLKKYESTYIAKGDKHSLINNQNIDLGIIEFQTGVKVSEKDIIRYNDIYGRN